VTAVLLGAAVFAYFSDQGSPFGTQTVVTAAFDDVGSLRTGDDVRIAGVRVGAVRDVSYRDGHAMVELEIDGKRPIYGDAAVSTASVGARSALGQKIVNLNPGTPGAGPIRPEQVIPQRDTRGAQEIGDLLAVFDPPTRDAMGSVLREVGGGLAGHQDDLNDLLKNAPAAVPALGTVSRALTADDGADLTALMSRADTLAGRFAGREQQISDLVSEVGTTLDAFGVDQTKPLTATLDTAPASLRDVRAALDSLNPPLADTEAAMTGLRPGAQALGAAVPDLRGVLREGVAPLDKVPGVMDTAEPAVTDLTTTMHDLQPLAPRLARTLDLASDPLSYLAPYAPEISQFFTGMAGAMKDGDAAGHWLRVLPMFSSESVTGAGIPIKDPTIARDAYPKPGEAEGDVKPTPLSGGRR
jgi:phospholipid/cholesterol/gamma-HCH transport system substrate-binding protein